MLVMRLAKSAVRLLYSFSTILYIFLLWGVIMVYQRYTVYQRYIPFATFLLKISRSLLLNTGAEKATPCFTAAPRGVPKSFERCSCAKAGSRKPMETSVGRRMWQGIFRIPDFYHLHSFVMFCWMSTKMILSQNRMRRFAGNHRTSLSLETKTMEFPTKPGPKFQWLECGPMGLSESGAPTPKLRPVLWGTSWLSMTSLVLFRHIFWQSQSGYMIQWCVYIYMYYIYSYLQVSTVIYSHLQLPTVIIIYIYIYIYSFL